MTARQWTREGLDAAHPLPTRGGWSWVHDDSVGWHARDNNGATVCVDNCGDLLALWNGTTIISPDADVCLAVILASHGLDSLGAMADALRDLDQECAGRHLMELHQGDREGACLAAGEGLGYRRAAAMLRRGTVKP